MPDPLLHLVGLTKRYGGLVVVDDVSLSLESGEIHALIGPNGAGKSTLIGLISGTVASDGGSVRLDGRDLTGLPLHRRARLGLGQCFQVSSIIPDFSALENVALAVQARLGRSFRFFRAVRDEPAFNRPALGFLNDVGLQERANVPAMMLSHGEARQLELAVVLAQQPRVLLLDEPLAGAGAEETAHFVKLLNRIRHHFGILLIEHDMQAVFALADRISVLAQGRLIATGDAASIRAHAEVRAAYLGEDELA